MTTDVKHEAVETYRNRAFELFAEARKAAASQRPIQARKLREAADMLAEVIVSEQDDVQPTGLEKRP